jgi:putative hydrolase of the HAD superfamily
MSAPVAVLFDLDDTLYLERDYVRSGFEAAGSWAERNAGLHGIGSAAWTHFQSGTRGKIFDLVVEALDISNRVAFVQQLIRVYRTHVPNIKLCEDAALILPELSERMCLGLITDGYSASQRNKIQALGIHRWMSQIIVTDEVGPEYRKPHACSFEMIEEKWSRAARRLVYVGDNPAKDFKTPRAMGWTTVRIRRVGGFHSKAEVAGNEAACDIESLLELQAVLSNTPSPAGKAHQ